MSKGTLAACIAAACAIAAPLAAKWEGYSPTVYKDSAGIPTYCYGETEMLRHDPARIYAKTECMALLRNGCSGTMRRASPSACPRSSKTASSLAR
jgi:GH24 family phage-related lysozyme (muramidase)